MKARTQMAILILVALFMLPATMSEAIMVHNFDCEKCHRTSASPSGAATWTTMDTGNVCLDCHGSSLTTGIENAMYWDVPTGQIVDPSPATLDTPTGYAIGDASDAMGSHPGSPADQTSHNWAAPDYQPAAGAQPPSGGVGSMYQTSRGASAGFVTCFRCHDPHGEDTGSANNKLLRVPGLQGNDDRTGEETTYMDATPAHIDKMCTECHADWTATTPADDTRGQETHPMVADYEANYGSVAAADPRFKPFAPTGANNGMALDTNGDLVCTTCHGLHFSDSNSATVDDSSVHSNGGYDNAGADGRLLKGDGVLHDQSATCTACHEYQAHPGGTSIGCLVCHGSHEYSSNPNFFMLRSDPASTGVDLSMLNGTKTGLKYLALPPDLNPNGNPSLSRAELWAGTGGSMGYCEGCHGDVTDTSVGGVSENQPHLETDNCTDCHDHSDPASSFEPKGCTTCHGSPPSTTTAGSPDGYAFVSGTRDYSATAGGTMYKPENATPHTTHAIQSPASAYEFKCEVCHNAKITDFAGTHNQDTYQNVLESGGGSYQFYKFTSPAGAKDVITYDTVIPSILAGDYYDKGLDPGTCSNLYCHTNGGRYRAGGKTINDFNQAADADPGGTPVSSVTWKGQKNTIYTLGNDGVGADECNSCHGNSADTMDAPGVGGDTNNVVDRYNSQTHIAHIKSSGKAYSCNVCHFETASSNTAVKSTATDTKHVNGYVELATDAAFELSAGNALGGGTLSGAGCAVYCHSNAGSPSAAYVESTPTWDNAASGACGTCHQYSNSGVATGAGAALGGAHAAHLFDADGPQISLCSTCHTHDGAMGTDHVDGALSFVANLQTAVCNNCHGATDGVTYIGNETDNDREPLWAQPLSVDCDTCHTGTDIAVMSTAAANYGANTNAPDKTSALTSGHNRPSGSYVGDRDGGTAGVQANSAANQTCEDCHDGATAGGHFDGDQLDKRLVGAFNCDTCHAGGGASAVNNTINTHSAQSCETCHDPHGSSNVFMVRSSSSSYDGGNGGTVVFTSTTRTGANSYDEDDGAAGGAGEVNADDVCATCHTVDGGTLHNNSDNSTGDHNQGLDCFTCHKSHTNAPSAFAAGAGTNCGDCHGFPPASGAHATHTTIVDGDLLNEDNTDCAVCHTGADSYTYSPAADQGASLNHSNAAGRVTILGTSVGYSENGTPADLTDDTCTSACHVSTKPGNATDDGFWTDTDLLCNACHGGTVSGVPTGDAHDKHIAASYGCADCHVGVDAAGTSPLTHNDAEDTTDEGTTLTTRGKDHVNTTGLDAEVNDQAHNDTVNSFVNGAGATDNTCSNTYCHDPSGGNTVDWDTGDSTTNCAFCHAGTAGNPATGSHTAHLTATADFGLTVTCLSCHPDNGTDTVHLDGTVDLPVVTTPATDYTDGASAAADLTDFGTGTYGGCTTTTCHNDGTGTAVKSPIWGATANDCTICHNDGAVGTTLPEAAPANGKHGTHVANTVFVPNVTGTGLVSMCDNCHGTDAETAATHIDGTADKGLHITSYAGASCANDCHTDDATDDWAVGGTLTCDNCHDSGKNTAGFTGALLDRGWPNGTNDPGFAHGVHILNFTATAYGKHVSGSYCIDCHNDNNTTHSAIQGNVTSPLLGAEVTAWDSGQKNCANSCHVANKASDWIGTARECTDCHTGTFIGGGGNRPQSGLHEATVALAHDVLFDTDKTCTSCHAPSPTVPHINGALQDSVATAYSFNATFITSYSEANGCAAKCHSDNAAIVADDGKWSRKWVGVTDAKPTAANNPGDAVCDNCHNDGIDSADGTTVDDSWNTGVSPVHGTDWDGDTTANEVLNPLSNHSTCQACHGWGNAAYDETWGTGDHGDGNINMNGPGGVGAEYDQTAWGCAAACHSGSFANGSGDANENHVLADSTWPVAFADFGSGDCDACHAGLGADHTDTNEDVTIHGLVSTPTGHGASSYITDCADCHTHDGISVAPGTGDHNNGTVNFNGTTLTATNYDRDASNFNGSCTNTCHDTDAAGEWAAGSLAAGDANGCLDCHDADVEAGVADGTMLLDQNGYPPTSNKHTLHLGATASLVDDCNACHGATANTGGQVGHVDTNIDLAGQITAGTDTCTNNCHNLDGVDGTNGNTDDARWQAADTDTIGCADCHNKASNALSAPIHASMDAGTGPITGKHSQHVGADASYVGAATCTTCHTHSGALSAGSNGHVDGTNPTLDGSISYTAPTCTNACHVTATGRDWSTGTLNCIDCHTTAKTLGAAGSATMSPTVAPNTGRHTVHMASNDYVPNNCTDCHGHSGVLGGGSNGHVDGADKTDIGVANEVSLYNANDTCTNTCHAVVDTRDWIQGAQVNGIALACADCHAATGKSLYFGGGWMPTTNAHAEHLGSNALPNATDQNECYVCHGTTVDNTGDLSGNSTHINNTAGDLSFDNTNYRYRATNIVPAGADATTTCSNVLCHNGDTTPQWGAGTIVCGSCHGTGGPLPSDTTARSHSKHANNDATYTDCDNCHGGITANISTNYTATGGAAAHQNLTVDLSFDTAKVPGAAYADGDGADGVNYSGDFTDDGTCSSVECHFNNGTPAWGGTISDCVSCHNNGTAGTTIEDSQPNSGWHVRHVEVADQDYVADCTPCHGASDGSHGGHGQLDGPDFAGAGTVVWDSGNNTCANACHVAANDDWDEATVEASQTGSLGCTDCHSQATKSLNAGGENDLSATTGPNAGRHDEHMAINNYVPNNCTDCHGHVGPLGIADGHVDGPDVNTITMDNATGKVTSYTTPGCVNQCHTVTTGPSDGDWVDTDPLTCTNCHNTSKLLDAGGDPWTSVDTVDGKHGTHAGAYTYGATGQSATGAGTTYNFGCGECHAGTHLNGTLPVTIADVQVTVGSFSTGDKSCGTSDCHNDGTTALGAPAATGNGNLNWGTVFTGDRCNKCHGNIPNSGAHTAHQVGIHWEDVYTGTTGLLTAGTEPSGHGGKMTDNVTPTSTVINCQVCHFNTVQDWYNDKNSTCATSCHNGTDVALQGDVTIAQRQNHITGSTDDNQAEVTFFGSPVRSKAQLRNDIEAVPEIGNNWKRMNDGVLQNLFYKGANAYDETEALLNTDTYTGGATPTCTTQCHNGNAATWVAPTGDCSVCHTQLPQ